MASQGARGVVVCAEALEDVPVERVVVVQRESTEELQEWPGEDEAFTPHLELGHWQDLVHSDEGRRL